jgi:hypothetical protein
MWLEIFFINMQQINWTSGITAGEDKERQRTDTPHTEEYFFKSHYTRLNISKKRSSK